MGSQAGVARLEIPQSGKTSSVCQHFARERDNEESPHTSIDASSKSPRPACLISFTGEKDHDVGSDDLSDMGEECDLRAATMPDVSLSEGVAVQQMESG